MSNNNMLPKMKCPLSASASQAGTHGGLKAMNKTLFEPAGEFCFVPPENRLWVAEKRSLDFLLLFYQEKSKRDFQMDDFNANHKIDLPMRSLVPRLRGRDIS